eukprot:TRINITY_DN12472_c0_g1_i2.p1 TRINITY_DN12472_c0_g1~~TRINITY_DN12472_c0_g1_i2.p1  ORF type:complete len:2014 (+),score=640.13 TRINITY_DN12472_c0_g1_i2:237-6044(+)
MGGSRAADYAVVTGDYGDVVKDRGASTGRPALQPLPQAPADRGRLLAQQSSVAQLHVEALRNATTHRQRSDALSAIHLAAPQVVPPQWVAAGLCEALCGLLVGTGRPLPKSACRAAARAVAATLRTDSTLRAFFRVSLGLVRSAAPSVSGLLCVCLLLLSSQPSATCVLLSCDPLPVLTALYANHLVRHDSRPDDAPSPYRPESPKGGDSASPPVLRDGGSSPRAKRSSRRSVVVCEVDSGSEGSPRHAGPQGLQIPRLSLQKGPPPLGESNSAQLLHGNVPADRVMRLVGSASGRPSLSNCRLSTNDVVRDFDVDVSPGKYKYTLMHLAHKLGRLYVTKDLPRLLGQRRGLGLELKSPRALRSPSVPPLEQQPEPDAEPTAKDPLATSSAADVDSLYDDGASQGNADVATLRLLTASLFAVLARRRPDVPRPCIALVTDELQGLYLAQLHEHADWKRLISQLEEVLLLCAPAAEMPSTAAVVTELCRLVAGAVPTVRTGLLHPCWVLTAESLRLLADFLAPARGTRRQLPLRVSEQVCEVLLAIHRACLSDSFSVPVVRVAAQLLRVFAALLDAAPRSPALTAFLWRFVVERDVTRQWLHAFTRVGLAHPSCPQPAAWAASFADVDQSLRPPGPTSVAQILADFWACLIEFMAFCAVAGVPRVEAGEDPSVWQRDSVSEHVEQYITQLDFLFSPVEGAVLSWLAQDPVLQMAELKIDMLRLTAALGELPLSPFRKASVSASYLRLHFLTLLEVYQHGEFSADPLHGRLASMHVQCLVRLVRHGGAFVRGRGYQLGMLDFVMEEIGLEASAEERRGRLLAERLQRSDTDASSNPAVSRRSVTWKKVKEDGRGPSPPRASSPDVVPPIVHGSARSGGDSLCLSLLALDDTPPMQPAGRSHSNGQAVAWQTSPRDAVHAAGGGRSAVAALSSSPAAEPCDGGAQRPPKVPALRLGQTPSRAPPPASSPVQPTGQSPATPAQYPLPATRRTASPTSGEPSASRPVRPKIPSLRLGGTVAPANWGTSEPATPAFTLPSVGAVSPHSVVQTPELGRSAVKELETSVPAMPLDSALGVPLLNESCSSPTDGGDVAKKLFGRRADQSPVAEPAFAPLSPGEPGTVLWSSTAFHSHERAGRALYSNAELHTWLVLLTLALLVDPSPQGTVDSRVAAGAGEALACLSAHLNHRDNAAVVYDALHEVRSLGEALGSKVSVLLKLLSVQLSSAAMYRSVRKLGSGAYGSVMLSEPDTLRPSGTVPIAVKHIPATKESLTDVFAEVLAMRACDDAHLAALPLLDWGCDGRTFQVSTPLCPFSAKQWRASLRQDAARRHLHLLMSVYHSVLEGVAAAHARGVVHCDLKCDNVLLLWPAHFRVPVALLCDWGESVFSAETARGARRARGTEHIRPPEVLLAHSAGKDYDRRAVRTSATPTSTADVWALGCLLFELLTGQLLLHDELFPRFFQRVTDAQEQLVTDADVSKLPPVKAVADLLSQALTRDSKRRPAVRDLLKQSAALIESLPPDESPPPPPPRPWEAPPPTVADMITALEPPHAQPQPQPQPEGSDAGQMCCAPLCRGVVVCATLSDAVCADCGITHVVCSGLERPDLVSAPAVIIPLGQQLAAALRLPRSVRRHQEKHAERLGKLSGIWVDALRKAAQAVVAGGRVAVVGRLLQPAVVFASAYLAMWHGCSLHQAVAGAVTAARRTRALPCGPDAGAELIARASAALHALSASPPVYSTHLPVRLPTDGNVLRLRCACGRCRYGVRSTRSPLPEARGWWSGCALMSRRLWGAPAVALVLRAPAEMLLSGNLQVCAASTPAGGGLLSPAAPDGATAHHCARCHYVTHLSMPGSVAVHASVRDDAASLDGAEMAGLQRDFLQTAVVGRAARGGPLRDVGMCVDLRAALLRRRAVATMYSGDDFPVGEGGGGDWVRRDPLCRER